MLNLCEPHLLSLLPYAAGAFKGRDHNMVWAKLGSNENCLGPSPNVLLAAIDSLTEAHLYPLGLKADVIGSICRHHSAFNIEPKHVALGNGSTELIGNLVRGLVGKDEAVMYGWPSFMMYQVAAISSKRRVFEIKAKDD